MRALVLLYVNQYMKFEMSSFTNYKKNRIGAKFKKNGSRDPDHGPFRAHYHHRLGFY